jgi:hypothetical protein
MILIWGISNQRGNQARIIQRHSQHWTHKTQDEDKQNTKTQHKTENSRETFLPFIHLDEHDGQ